MSLAETLLVVFQYVDIVGVGANLRLDPKISREIEEELRLEMI